MKIKFILTCLIFFIGTKSYSQCFIGSFGSLGQLSKTTGNYALDNKFNGSKVDLELVFSIRVDLYAYYDGNKPNAFATSSQNFDGLVAFGLTMLSERLWNMSKGEYAIAGVMAHEFAHVLQIKKKNSLSTKEKELQADFLAGYYFGKRQFLAYGIKNFATDLFELGDYYFWDPQHHGTPHERVAAMMEGYDHSDESISQAYQSGLDYVTGEDTISDEDCSRCDGEGIIEVKSNCYTCNATGFRPDPNCGGMGGAYAYGYNGYRQYGYWWYICNVCMGNKVVGCDQCISGKITETKTCPICDGTGKN